MRHAPITLFQPEFVAASPTVIGDACCALMRWSWKQESLPGLNRPERVRNVVDMPLLPDEMSQANDERRKRKQRKGRS